MQIDHARDLSVVDQAFIDAVFAHNGRQPPRKPPVVTTTGHGSPSSGNLRLLEAVLGCLDADSGYDDWFRIGAGVFHETGGSMEGYHLFDAWSKKGMKYKGAAETRAKWRSCKPDHPRPVRLATLRRMVEANGFDWIEVCAAAEDGFDELADDTEVGA